MSPPRRALLLALTLSAGLLCAAPAGATTIAVIGKLPGVGLSGVTCLTPSLCQAFGTDLSDPTDTAPNRLLTITAGTAGRLQSLAGPLAGLACPSATTCLALGSDADQGALRPIVNGVRGPTVDVPGTMWLRAAACGSPTTCEAVGRSSSGEGAVVRIVGGVPGPAQVVPGSMELDGVACTGATACEAVGDGPLRPDGTMLGVVVPITRGVPGTARPVAGTAELLDVACPAATVCEAVGAGPPLPGFGPGVVVPIIRGAPRAAAAVAGTSVLSGVACAGATVCQAVGQGPQDFGSGAPGAVVPIGAGPGPAQPVAATPFALGAFPGAPQELEPTSLAGIVCPRASSCLAVGGLGDGVAVRLDAFTCRRTITAGHTGPLVLSTGSTCLSGAHIRGSVSVLPGAALEITNSTITGSVTARRPADVRICASRIDGSVAVRDAVGLVLVGDAVAEQCAADTIGGSLQLAGNAGGLEAVGDRVGGRVRITGNTGAAGLTQDAAPEVSGNGRHSSAPA
ncbi:MAG TPA: hypothetical protein VG165_10170 [Solirubrobacteraceae bacterium]|nr:hypothetical protein [Solirubrobacteraceae bacterium]